MKKKYVLSAAMLFFIYFWVLNASAHYPVFFLNKSPIKVKQRETVKLFYGRGHLYKREWSKTPKPDWVKAVYFDGMTQNINIIPENKHFKFSWKVNRPGDTWLVVHTPLGWSEHDSCWVETSVRTILHVGFSRGWQEIVGLTKLEILPLTRPYGLLPGDVMRVKVLKDKKGVPRQMVYAERYYPKAPKGSEVPVELLMRSVQTDSDGVAAVTLREAGWWVIFTVVEDGTKKLGDKDSIIQREDALWIYVEKGF